MLKPKVKNRYNLTPSKLKKLRIPDISLINEESGFRRNDVTKSWILFKSTAKNDKDIEYCTYDDFMIHVYDKDSKFYKGNDIEVEFSAFGGMCSYNISKFYDKHEIECRLDLEIQEMFMETMNELLDKGIFVLNK